MNDLGAAVIGLGIGRQHVIGFEQTDGSRPVAVCDFSQEKLQQLHQEFPTLEQTTRWESLLERADVGLVAIASFDDDHCEQVCRSLEAGKHVFVEKPLCLKRNELELVSRRWREKGDRWIASNLVLRSAPIYVWLREQIRAGHMGKVYAIDGDYLYGRIHKIVDGWRSEVDGYSVMMGGGIHMADLMLWLTGDRPSRVRATGNSICTATSKFRYPDFVNATYLFESGMIGRITANFGCVHRHQHVLRVFGTEATFIYDDQGPRWIDNRDPETPARAIELDPLPAHKWDLIPDLVAGINSGDTPVARVQQEFDLISICLAADESVACDSEIEIEYV